MKKLLIISLLFSTFIYSQTYPKDFRYPLNIPILLSANYSELRNNHFHAGIDIKTQQREGLKVYSAAEGYVSRINISPYGYGKALYITHPNGYTTVYGHLKNFTGEIEKRARKEQYEKNKFDVDFYLKPNELPLSKGDYVALSGNTGGSGGPHVHFEVRDSKTEEILNPFLFGVSVPDHVEPKISEVWVYPIEGFVKGKSTKSIVNGNETISASGFIGFGIKAFDKQDGAANTNGVYYIKTYVDNELISHYQTDKHAFTESRYINASTDYNEHIANNSWIYRTYLLPGNELQMYKESKNKGILEVKEGATYSIKIIVGDFAENTSTRTFNINGTKNNYTAESKEDDYVSFNKSFTLKKDGITASFEKGDFYENFNFKYEKIDSKHQLHYSNTPVHKRFKLEIKPDWNTLDKSKENKYIIIREPNKGKYKKEFLSTKYENGVYTAEPRDLGLFSLELDESKPTVSCPTLAKTKKVNNYLQFIIKDKGTGINTYDVYINDKWILAEYDYKTNKLFIPDLQAEEIISGSHELKVIVTDEVNNETIYTNNFDK